MEKPQTVDEVIQIHNAEKAAAAQNMSALVAAMNLIRNEDRRVMIDVLEKEFQAKLRPLGVGFGPIDEGSGLNNKPIGTFLSLPSHYAYISGSGSLLKLRFSLQADLKIKVQITGQNMREQILLEDIDATTAITHEQMHSILLEFTLASLRALPTG